MAWALLRVSRGLRTARDKAPPRPYRGPGKSPPKPHQPAQKPLEKLCNVPNMNTLKNFFEKSEQFGL